MSPFTYLLFFFLFLHLCVLPSVMMEAISHPDIINDTCNRIAERSPNVNYTLCVESLSSVPRSHHADLKGLALISVKLTRANAAQARNKVKELILAAGPKEGYYKSCLEACLDLFSGAISSLNDTRGKIRAGRYQDVNLLLSSVLDAPVTCEDGFEEGEIKSPLVAEDDSFFKLAAIALGITALLG